MTGSFLIGFITMISYPQLYVKYGQVHAFLYFAFFFYCTFVGLTKINKALEPE